MILTCSFHRFTKQDTINAAIEEAESYEEDGEA
jgi:hypothetical protein